MKKVPAVLAGALAIALTAGGCANTGAASSDDASGPITLMVIESMTGVTGVDQTAPDGARAAAEAINADGGIGARDIEIVDCDTASDPNKSTECARDAVSQGVTAVVGSFDPIGIAAALPVLEAAGIPYISPTAATPTEFSNSVSFPASGGAPAGQFGMVAAAKDAGCSTVGTFSDTAADGGQGELLTQSIENAGMDSVFVDLPSTTTDVTPAVSQLLDGNPDCVAFAASGALGVQLFSAIRRAGSDAKFISATATLIPQFLAALGADGEGLIATQDTPPLDSQDLQPFRDDIAEYAPDLTAPNPFTLTAWYGVQVFQQAAGGLEEVTAETVLDSLGSLEDVSLPGMSPVDFTKGLDRDVYPRMFNPTVQYATVQNGTYVPGDGQWVDLTDYIP